jgi:hypothetical protein
VFNSCVCSEYAGDSPELFSKQNRIARKVHHCCECNEEIAPGKKYEYAKGLWDGDFQCFCTCLPCSNIRKSLFRGGYTYTSMWEDIALTYCADDGDESWLK